MSKSLISQKPVVRDRALVFGGGGSAGYAWEIGVVAGLFEAGLDVTKPDVMIGTSAGSTAAVYVASQISPIELLSAILAATPPSSQKSSTKKRTSNRPSVNYMEITTEIITASRDAADMRRKMGAGALGTDAASDSAAEAQRRATIAARMTYSQWPEQLVQIVAVNAYTGEPTVFDRHTGVDLIDAITASTASFGAPPHTINGDRYIDGGYRRNENADLAAGYERVLVLSPFGGRSRHPLEWGMQLATQVEELRAGGSKVETIFPDGKARDIFAGTNQMDSSIMPLVAEAGYKQGRALAERLTDFWR